MSNAENQDKMFQDLLDAIDDEELLNSSAGPIDFSK